VLHAAPIVMYPGELLKCIFGIRFTNLGQLYGKMLELIWKVIRKNILSLPQVSQESERSYLDHVHLLVLYCIRAIYVLCPYWMFVLCKHCHRAYAQLQLIINNKQNAANFL
jgi:hypothetical protein